MDLPQQSNTAIWGRSQNKTYEYQQNTDEKNGEQATYIAGEHAAHENGEHAHNKNGEQADNTYHNFMESGSIQDKMLMNEYVSVNNPRENNDAKQSATLPKMQLHSKTCSINFQQWADWCGIGSNIFTAVLPCVASADSKTLAPEVQPDAHSQYTFSSLLSYSMSLSEIEIQSPTAYLAWNNANDILTQSPMLKTEDAEQFIQSRQDEITGLNKFEVIDIHHISELPAKAKLISSIWSYRWKQLPNKILLKYKSRIYVNGKEQELSWDYWETYAPVASWSTIRLLILLSSVMDLKTRQVIPTIIYNWSAIYMVANRQQDIGIIF